MNLKSEFKYVLDVYTKWKKLEKSISSINDFRKKKMRNEKIERKPNFPECVSEFIGRQVMNGIYDGKGDMIVKGKRVEIKSISSIGPTSFGPTETWDEIIFIDFRKEPMFTIYKIDLPNHSSKWKNIKINKHNTFEDQCKMKRRPRISFDEISKQIKPKIIYENNILVFLKNEN